MICDILEISELCSVQSMTLLSTFPETHKKRLEICVAIFPCLRGMMENIASLELLTAHRLTSMRLFFFNLKS